MVCRLHRAFGIVPIFLSEISPPAFRSTFTGVTYQLGYTVASVFDPIADGQSSTLQWLDCDCSHSIFSHRKPLPLGIPGIKNPNRGTRLQYPSGYSRWIRGCLHHRLHLNRPRESWESLREEQDGVPARRFEG